MQGRRQGRTSAISTYPGQVDFVYNIHEGHPYRVGRISVDIKGENPHTQITTVLNRLSFQPGDIADMRECATASGD